MSDITITIDDATLSDREPRPACGDPYVAVLIEDIGPGAPTETQAITLGTGFESIEQIARAIKHRVENPDDYDLEIGFAPTEAHIFSLAGTISYARQLNGQPLETHTVSIGDDTYTIEAANKLDARYRAASRHKEAMGGPDVGIGVEDLAGSATVVDAPEL